MTNLGRQNNSFSWEHYKVHEWLLRNTEYLDKILESLNFNQISINCYTKFYSPDASSLTAWTQILSDNQNVALCCIYIAVFKLQFVRIVTDEQVGCCQNWLTSGRLGWKAHSWKVGSNFKCHWDRSHAKIHRRANWKGQWILTWEKHKIIHLENFKSINVEKKK